MHYEQGGPLALHHLLNLIDLITCGLWHHVGRNTPQLASFTSPRNAPQLASFTSPSEQEVPNLGPCHF